MRCSHQLEDYFFVPHFHEERNSDLSYGVGAVNKNRTWQIYQADCQRGGLLYVLVFSGRVMRALMCLLPVVVAALSPCKIVRATSPPQFVLFVGNSLTYVGNTPAVFDAMAHANGNLVSSDMIVRGGATLAQRVADGSVARALDSKNYSAVVLQERGGELMCSFGPGSCTDSRKAIQALALLARDTGAEAYLLGTYQGNLQASELLVEAESAAAAEAGIQYLEVSRKLQLLRTARPTLGWLATDGMHPGPALTLLNAIALHQALFGTPPQPVSFRVVAPIYGSTSGLTESLRTAEDPPPLANTPSNIEYSAEMQKGVLQSMQPGKGC